MEKKIIKLENGCQLETHCNFEDKTYSFVTRNHNGMEIINWPVTLPELEELFHVVGFVITNNE